MRIKREEGYIAVFGDFKVLSSAVFNGGYKSAKTIINLNVPKNFDDDPECVFESFISSNNFESVVGVMTAASMKNASVVEETDVIGIVTAGSTSSSQTINIILLINKDLIESAMVNAVIVATEAKVAALFDLGLKDGDEIMTGTPTDSVVIACHGTERVRYAGPATDIGSRIYGVVRKCVKDAMIAQEGIHVMD